MTSDTDSSKATESTSTPIKSEINNNNEVEQDPSGKKWGYDLYPERKSEERYSSGWKFFIPGYGRETNERLKCEMRVWEQAKTAPLVKLMLAALKSSGCEVDLGRHVVCEMCDSSVTGGYDPETNQIVVCQNRCKRDGLVAAVLTHELIHMFDYCRHNLDFTNAEHLACTEIRAASLTHCSFMSSMAQGDSLLWDVAETHKSCVRTKAAFSVDAVRRIGMPESWKIVDRVFPHCYPDLEPIGRSVRRNSPDMLHAYNERAHYGYGTV